MQFGEACERGNTESESEPYTKTSMGILWHCIKGLGKLEALAGRRRKIEGILVVEIQAWGVFFIDATERQVYDRVSRLAALQYVLMSKAI